MSSCVHQRNLRITSTPSNLTKYAQKTLHTNTLLTKGGTKKTFHDTEKIKTRRFMSVHWVACSTCYSKKEGTELDGIALQRSRQFFLSGGSLRLFKGSPRSRASRGPLAHTFIRRNRSFSEVKSLVTSLLIICQKEKIPVVCSKNRHALRTCGSAVTQRFIPYCQLPSRLFKLSLHNM